MACFAPLIKRSPKLEHALGIFCFDRVQQLMAYATK
jgi:hypothetical protein